MRHSKRYGRMTQEKTYAVIRAVQEKKRNAILMGGMQLVVDGWKKRAALSCDTNTLEDSGVRSGAALTLLVQHAGPERAGCCARPG